MPENVGEPPTGGARGGSAPEAPGPATPAASAQGVFPVTGHPEVDAVLRTVSALDELPLDQHAEAFERAHQRLAEVLAASPPAGRPGGSRSADTTAAELAAADPPGEDPPAAPAVDSGGAPAGG